MCPANAHGELDLRSRQREDNSSSPQAGSVHPTYTPRSYRPGIPMGARSAQALRVPQPPTCSDTQNRAGLGKKGLTSRADRQTSMLWALGTSRGGITLLQNSSSSSERRLPLVCSSCPQREDVISGYLALDSRNVLLRGQSRRSF